MTEGVGFGAHSSERAVSACFEEHSQRSLGGQSHQHRGRGHHLSEADRGERGEVPIDSGLFDERGDIGQHPAQLTVRSVAEAQRAL